MSAFEVITAHNEPDLNKRVRSAIRRGMMPCGGVAISHVPQSWIQYEGDKPVHVTKLFAQSVCDPAALLPAVQNLVKKAKRKK